MYQKHIESIFSVGRRGPDEPRTFLLLQGPHGPFFDRLGKQLRAAGATVWRAGFNAGDEFFWSDKARYIRHAGPIQTWPEHLERIIAERGITDIVLYGDVRPAHAAARAAARLHGLTLHVVEEGYLRPYWVTYERGGSNGHSRLMQIDLPEMQDALKDVDDETLRPPARWGDVNQHKFYGAFYHFLVLVANRKYPGYRSHREISVMEEFHLQLRKLLLSPLFMIQSWIESRRIRRGGFPYHLVLMQLEHDSSFRAHSSYDRMKEFTDECLTEFARSAAQHHHMVFKAHPLEDGRSRNRRNIFAKAAELGISDRVHYLRGGKLAQLLSQARAAITVNSTAAQQALWRGLPVKVMGRGVYDKPELVSPQSIGEFIKNPQPPSSRAYRTYRSYLLHTSQIPGGFYAARSRAPALRHIVDMMLAPADPYEALADGCAAHRQQLADQLV
ncbi:capsule biosynthesis protein CapA [Paracoccus zhejiangensis]|uniref:Capsule biosynthesis protein CapA n=1 Tax=Paracoccus zhejiangensis TaxID=1077935 RepID=A0A2H5EW49_9RHOB|nr:capsule biosynthesis protein CapA [Paracoccus zhejiangensis]AUH63519.1 capsule biosynthesis protein CapA [Paracoccus zhejiangensis]